jgi:hypothetical protein
MKPYIELRENRAIGLLNELVTPEKMLYSFLVQNENCIGCPPAICG